MIAARVEDRVVHHVVHHALHRRIAPRFVRGLSSVAGSVLELAVARRSAQVPSATTASGPQGIG
ncbi:MAG TPA: hypothetical protein VF488_13880, partial [Gemmatimonadaceae bacterium]